MTSRIGIRQGHSILPDAGAAVRELAAQIAQDGSGVRFAFFSDEYNHQELASALKECLPGPVIGCTTAGQLTSQGYQRCGMSGASWSSAELTAVPYLIHPLSSLLAQVELIALDIQKRLNNTGMKAFGLLLIDGLSGKEELLTASLYRLLGDVPILGGSAGDMLKFKQSFVYFDGALYNDAAVFTLFLTSLPFYVFKHQHFLPTPNRLVITEADPEQRLVREINGERAVDAYARLVGKQPGQLSALDFSKHPLMLRIRDDYYVRSIAGIEADGSLKFYCAIDTGLVLTIGEGHMANQAFERTLSEIKATIGEPAVILGCDCVLRRLELEELGIVEEFGMMLAQNKVFGFNTYGEQFHSVHIN